MAQIYLRYYLIVSKGCTVALPISYSEHALLSKEENPELAKAKG
jgi:hypothetical protein